MDGDGDVDVDGDGDGDGDGLSTRTSCSHECGSGHIFRHIQSGCEFFQRWYEVFITDDCDGHENIETSQEREQKECAIEFGLSIC